MSEKTERWLENRFGKEPENTEYKLEGILDYYVHAQYADKMDSEKCIDEITWNDLSMDDVYKRINNCSSSVGEEYLYKALHEIKSKEELDKRETIINYFDENPRKRLETQQTLYSMGKSRNNGVSYFMFNADAKQLKHSWIYPILAVLAVIGLILIPININYAIGLLLLTGAVNIILSAVMRMKMEREMETIKFFSSLVWVAKQFKSDLNHVLIKADMDIRKPLKPFELLHGIIPSGAGTFINEMETLFIIIKMIFLVDILKYKYTVDTMIKHTEELNDIFQIIGEVETAVSVLSFRKSLPGYCKPEFTDEEYVEFKEIYHPLLYDPVVNTGKMQGGNIITGSNASGKSTFIKAIAINNIMAQSVNTCCAQEYRMKPAYVATSMAMQDSIYKGESYFTAEVRSLKRILDYCEREYCTCFIDEILRGTNTNERIAASTAVMRNLEKSGSLCVVASHDIELTEILKDTYSNYHFCETILDDNIEFDYKLKYGPSKTTNAIKLLKIMGFDGKIVEEAERLAQRK